MADTANSGGKGGAGTASSGGAGGEKKKGHEEASLAGVVDTIEAVIIALVVALTFRAFILEAFVIPTGSMAPTLLGAHFKVICPKCGYEFDRNARLDHQAIVDQSGIYQIPAGGNGHAELGRNDLVPCDDLPIFCPNCRYAITNPKDLPQFLNMPEVLDGRSNSRHPVPFAWANNGDRILVLKYLYSVLEPRRWDVIVFKEPENARDNYIKRLIGLPGDTVQVVNGDWYIGRGEEGKADASRRWIARKPEDIQRSLWQLVYDNDYYPTDEGRPRKFMEDGRQREMPTWENPWQPAAGTWEKGTTMRFGGNGAGALAFHPLPAGMPANYPPYGLNTLGYNNDLYVDEYRSGSDFAPRSMVGDLRLEAFWSPGTGGEGGVKLTLGRPNNCYQVSWSAAGLTLARYDEATGSFKPVAATAMRSLPAPRAGGAYRLALNNVDHAVAFYVDGEKALEYAEPWTAEQAIADLQAHPADWTNAPGMRVPTEVVNTMIRVDVQGPCDVSHLKVYRDLYYTQVLPGYTSRTGQSVTGTQDHPVTLGADEFFALGDNSRASNDGRLWRQVYDPLADLGLRPGIVPRRCLLGKAFFVYWPAGFRPTKDVWPFKQWPIVPNTGDMRIIR
jgi:signal peptidase I